MTVVLTMWPRQEGRTVDRYQMCWEVVPGFADKLGAEAGMTPWISPKEQGD